MWEQRAKMSAEDEQALKQALEAAGRGDVNALGGLLKRPGMLAALGQLIAPVAGDLIKKLSDMSAAHQRRALYEAVARPLARSVGCEVDEMAAWLEHHAEPNAALDIAQRQAASRAGAKLGQKTILLEVSYARQAAGRYEESARAWLIDATGAVEHTSARAVSLDALPDAARAALVAGERLITFKLIG